METVLHLWGKKLLGNEPDTEETRAETNCETLRTLLSTWIQPGLKAIISGLSVTPTNKFFLCAQPVGTELSIVPKVLE